MDAAAATSKNQRHNEPDYTDNENEVLLRVSNIFLNTWI